MLAGGVFSWLVMMPAIYLLRPWLSPSIPARRPSPTMEPVGPVEDLRPPHGRGGGRRGGLDYAAAHRADDYRRALAEGLRNIRTSNSNSSRTEDLLSSRSTPPLSSRSEAEGSASRTTTTLRTAHDLPMSVRLRAARILLVILLVVFLHLPSRPRRAGRPAREHLRRRCSWSSSASSSSPSRPASWASSAPVVVAGLGHDHRHPDGHIRHLPRQAAGPPRRSARWPSPSAESSASPPPTPATPRRI